MTTAPRAILIFAAGFGTRMGALTADRPKPMIPVAGRPMIDHALDLTEAVKPDRVVVNTHYQADVLHAHLRTRDVVISHEAGQILDTGGGLKQARPLLNSDCVFTLNPDVAWNGPNPLKTLEHEWKDDHMDALLLCVPTHRAIGRIGSGDFSITQSGHIQRGGDMVYTGAQIVKPDLLDQIPETVFSLNLLWDMLIADGRACAVEYPGQWCDVGRPDGIELAEKMMASSDV
ncbi:MAG: nucleotidyltransferase [Alphaproteobacteria bacterium MedPE-SWcel]|nr:MAG: nucleotidyltransferase [Alphaproteobacteria bacterium MedPE-SWcel]